jgi:hypothetical protein
LGQVRRPPDPSFTQTGKGLRKPTLTHPARLDLTEGGWHIIRDGQDVYSRQLKWKVRVLGGFGKLVRAVDLDDQVEARR